MILLCCYLYHSASGKYLLLAAERTSGNACFSNKGRSMELKFKDQDKSSYNVAEDVAGSKVLFVNYYMIGIPGKNNPWVLVDAALPGSAKRILKEAEDRFGKNNPPKAIILTHGHFDHVSALPDLIEEWPEVQIYAHTLELPFLTGKSSYPPPDPTAGGGAMAWMSWVYPVKPIDLGSRVSALPANGTLPELPDWKYYHTPGHSPGHISLFRERDRLLIAGDAFVTTNQNSFTSVMLQRKEMHGPPAYFTINWEDSLNSIKKLAALNPDAAGTGHGKPVFGEELRASLTGLIRNFQAKEVPAYGRYTRHPVITDEEGIHDVPDPVSYKAPRYIAGALGVLALAGAGLWVAKKISKSG